MYVFYSLGQLGYFIIKPALPRILCVKIQEVAALKYQKFPLLKVFYDIIGFSLALQLSAHPCFALLRY